MHGGMSPSERDELIDMAVRWLTLYADELGDFLAKLVDNKAAWRAGYDEIADCYWVTPSTGEGYTLRPPFMSIKFDAPITRGESQAL